MKVDGNLMRGGAELMIDRTIEELEKLGVEVEILTPTTRQLGDLVHFFGAYDSHWSPAHIAISRNIPYVCTPIFSSNLTESQERIRRKRQKLTGRFPRLQRKLFQNAKAIVTPTVREEKRIKAYFGLDQSIHFERIPHGVDQRFASATPDLFRNEVGIADPFILHVGAYSPTKNQLNLVRALKGSGIGLVCAGHVMDRDYLNQCKTESDANHVFLESIPHESDLLPSAYAAASAFVLPSYNEAFCLAAMEALVARCPIVLGNRWEAEELYGTYATYVNPDNVDQIRAAAYAAFKEGKRDIAQSQHFLGLYSWQKVTEDLKKLYERTLP